MRNNSLSYCDTGAFQNITYRDYNMKRRMTIFGSGKNNIILKKSPFLPSSKPSQMSMFASDIDSVSNLNSSRYDNIIEQT